jgi:hypothetical protein
MEKKEFSTCLEGIPYAELMQKMMIGKQGIGSLCSEMMKKVMESQGEGTGFHCFEVMRSMMEKSNGKTEEPEKAKGEEDHEGK